MKLAKKVLVIMSLLIMSGTLFNAMRFRYDLNDAFLRTVFFIFEDTRWAKEYTEEGFDRLTIGMSADEVVQIIGKPLRKTCADDGCDWVYTWQQASTLDFDRRALVFDENMLLKQKIRFYFID
jgi:outer membrane protein assembly factor BamE (lipoprotein component of BamABCDE complex)